MLNTRMFVIVSLYSLSFEIWLILLEGCFDTVPDFDIVPFCYFFTPEAAKDGTDFGTAALISDKDCIESCVS